MAVYIRMALYFFFPMAAAYGFGTWDEAAGTFTVTLDADALATFIAVNAAAYGVTFGLGRVAKANGGAS